MGRHTGGSLAFGCVDELHLESGRNEGAFPPALRSELLASV